MASRSKPKAKAAMKPAAKIAAKRYGTLALAVQPSHPIQIIPDLSDPEDSRMFAESFELSQFYRTAGAR